MGDPREDVADLSRETVGGAPRSGRRLTDKILVAVHHACDQGELEAAAQLLSIAEGLIVRGPAPPDGSRRRSLEGLVAGFERLWFLRHPAQD